MDLRRGGGGKGYLKCPKMSRGNKAAKKSFEPECSPNCNRGGGKRELFTLGEK